ncbi:MAG TPA: family 43 glycosylhydrolase [Puia sp.]
MNILWRRVFWALILLSGGSAVYAQNPIIQTIYTADPAPMVYKDTLFLYTGHDEDKSTWFVMKDWHAYSTTDMVNWTDRGSPLSLKTFSWAEKDAWAGQCIYRNGKFYYYVPVNMKGAGMSIGVAVGDGPTGPFRDALGKPLVTGGYGYIDPTVFIDDNGQAYLYWGNPHLYYVKLNEDMVSYDQAVGVVKVPLTEEAFRLRIIDAGKTFAWAESIDGTASHNIKGASGKYYWYVSAIDRNTHKKVIGVGVGEKANGPFRDVLGRPLIREISDEGNINPTVIFDEGKQPWLTWGSSEPWYAKLSGDMVSYDEVLGLAPIPADKKEWFVRKIKGTVNSTEKRFTTYEEGPWLYKRSSLYYLFYPAGGVPEHLAYSTAATAVGPWKYGDTVMGIIGKGGAFTNHPGVVDYKGKTYLFYHNGALPGGGGFDRSVCVDELNFRADGSVQRVTPSAGIRDAVGNVNPYGRVEAETIVWESGVETAGSDSTGVYVTDIDEGDYIKVRNVDFGSGAKSFEAKVAAGPGGAIEIYVDSAGGEPIGTCWVKGTQGKWEMQSCRVKKVKGIHDVFLVFRGQGGKLFDFDWYKFKL